MDEIWETTAVGATLYHAFPDGASVALCSNIAPVGGDYLFSDADVRKLGGTLCDACYNATTGGNKMAKININAPEGITEVENIESDIERVRSLNLVDEPTDELAGGIEGRISNLTGKGSVEIRKQLRDLMREAAAIQPTTVTLASEGFRNVEGVSEIVDKAAEEVSAAVTRLKSVGSQARAVADLLISTRIRLTNPRTGLPDLHGRGKAAREAAAAVYAPAKAALTDDDVDGADALKALKSTVNNHTRNVLVTWLRGLDELPTAEVRALFPSSVKIAEGEHTESVYAAYAAADVALPRTTYNENQREIMRKNSARLTEGDVVAEDSTTDELTKVLTRRADITTRSVESIVDAAKRQKLGSKERKDLKDRLEALAGRIALEASQL